MEFDIKNISREINEMLWRQHQSVSTAESCTAGRIASTITTIPGSSNYFKGGLVCYSNELKQELLKVDSELIEENTAVCEEVVKQMVIGANELFKTDVAVAISGWAGPTAPDGICGSGIVGTIWIAVGKEGNIVTKKLVEDHGREKNLTIATKEAMAMLRDYLKEILPPLEEDEQEPPVIFV